MSQFIFHSQLKNKVRKKGFKIKNLFQEYRVPNSQNTTKTAKKKYRIKKLSIQSCFYCIEIISRKNSLKKDIQIYS